MNLSNVYVVGDTHGAWHTLIYEIQQNISKFHNSAIIIVGDANVGFNPTFEVNELYPALNKLFKDNDIMLYVVRGNHDNPKWFDGKTNYAHIKFLKNNKVLKLKVRDENINILCLGGAISINRTGLTKWKNYFPTEPYKFDPIFLVKLENIDYVISHDAPLFCPPYGVNNNMIAMWAKNDKTLINDLSKSRNNLSQTYEILKKKNKIKQWIYGHMHQSIDIVYEDIPFKCLDILEIKKLL